MALVRRNRGSGLASGVNVADSVGLEMDIQEALPKDHSYSGVLVPFYLYNLCGKGMYFKGLVRRSGGVRRIAIRAGTINRILSKRSGIDVPVTLLNLSSGS